MKRLSLTIIASAFCLAMSGQQINHRLNSYRSDEMLTKQRVETDIDELLGSKGNWNLEGAEVSRKRYRCAYTLLEDTLTGRERGERTCLRESPAQPCGPRRERFVGLGLCPHIVDILEFEFIGG